MMMIFKYNKTINQMIALLSLLGVFTLPLPWIEYPKIELVLKGSNGDGWVISFFFLLILLFSLYTLFSNSQKHGKRTNMFTFFFAILILALSISKILTFNKEISDSLMKNPITEYASAGANLKIGLYAISGLSFVIGVLSILGILFTKVRNLIVLGIIFGVIGLTYFLVNRSYESKNRLPQSEKIANMTKDFESMSHALVYKTPEVFVNYVHPIIYQSVGGKTKMVSMINEMYANLNITGAEIVEIEVIEEKENEIQALVQQKFTFDQAGVPNQQTNRTISFSYDGGNNWIFAGVENKSFEEMRKVIPEIFDELKY